MNGFPEEYSEGKIYGSESDGFTISYRNQWIAGVYDNIDAAKKAIDIVADGQEQKLDDIWLRNRPTNITLESLVSVGA